MHKEEGLEDAAELFKVLGNESRLWLIRLLGKEPRTVGALTEVTGMSQPLVSQHLRTLRQAGLVTATRQGKAVIYTLADEHVIHIVADALVHVQEPVHVQNQPLLPGLPQGRKTPIMADTHKQAEHTVAEHEHGEVRPYSPRISALWQRPRPVSISASD